MLGLGNTLGGGMVSEVPFSPIDIGNLALWLKYSAGNTAPKWDDSSGNSNDATQSTAGDQASISGGGLSFDGDDWYNLDSKIEIDAQHNVLVGIVFKVTDPFQQANLLSDNANEFFQLGAGGKDVKIKTGTVNNCNNTGATVLFNNAAGVQSLLISRNDGSTGTWKFYRNSVDMEALTGYVSGPGTNNGKIDFDLLGANSNDTLGFLGIIYEVVVYDLGTTTLTASQITNVNNYLTNLASGI